MDTITHGIAGALPGKAFFEGYDLFTFRPYSQARLVTLAARLGSVFPDEIVSTTSELAIWAYASSRFRGQKGNSG